MSVNYHVFSSIHASLLLGNPPIWSCVAYCAAHSDLIQKLLLQFLIIIRDPEITIC